MKTARLFALVLCLLVLAHETVVSAVDSVRVERLPTGGIQPQSVVDAEGTVHIVYLTGDPRACDVQYTFRKAGDSTFAPAIRVNSQPGSAVAMGTIRGVQLAVSKEGVVHVLWNGSQSAEPKQGNGSPLLYARKPAGSKTFEPQRNLMTKTYALDGGSSIAVGSGGEVYAAWHASKVAQGGKESDRAAYLSISTDGGKTFSQEREVSPPKSGSCACCGMRVAVDQQGAVNLLFRAAFSPVDRDILWLRSLDQGKNFTVVQRSAWKTGACPMSSAWLRDGWAAWEANGKVMYSRLDGSREFTPSGEAKRKYPVAVQANDGRSLVLWTEGTGWQKGGAVAWQILGADGKPAGAIERQEGLPVWGVATAWAGPKGGWIVLY